jgi:hypothetical protein
MKMNKLSSTSISFALAAYLIFGLGAIWSQEKEKDKNKSSIQETISIVKDKSGAVTQLSKFENIDEDLTADAKTDINLRMELIEIRPSETKLIASPVVRTQNGLAAEFLQGSNEVSLSISVRPTIVENRGIELKVKCIKKPEMKEYKEETVLARNSQPVVIELLRKKEGNSKLAIKITPFVDTKAEAKEFPNPVKELQFVRSFLILNSDKLIAKGGLSVKNSDGEILPYFFVQGKGIYILSFQPFEGAEPKGLLKGKSMRIKLAEDKFDWYSQEPILPEGLWYVWIRHNPNIQASEIEKTYMVLETKNGFAGLLFGKDSWKKFFTD